MSDTQSILEVLRELRQAGPYMTGLVIAELERLERELAEAKSAIDQFHHAMKDAGWHPGRTDDKLTDIIRAKGAELEASRKDAERLRVALSRSQAKSGAVVPLVDQKSHSEWLNSKYQSPDGEWMGHP